LTVILGPLPGHAFEFWQKKARAVLRLYEAGLQIGMGTNGSPKQRSGILDDMESVAHVAISCKKYTSYLSRYSQ
jgi:hypothetical protein